MWQDKFALTVHNENWKKLDEYVKRLKIEEPSLIVWKEIEDKPLNAEFMDEMIAQKWKAISEFMHLMLDGICDYGNKVFRLNNFLSGYQRDKCLFHEIAHLRYDLNDNPNHQEFYRNAAIAEWVGRKSRANPELLARAVFDFGLEVQIYDLASYKAFYEIGNISFRGSPRLKKFYEKIGTFMD